MSVHRVHIHSIVKSRHTRRRASTHIQSARSNPSMCYSLRAGATTRPASLSGLRSAQPLHTVSARRCFHCAAAPNNAPRYVVHRHCCKLIMTPREPHSRCASTSIPNRALLCLSGQRSHRRKAMDRAGTSLPQHFWLCQVIVQQQQAPCPSCTLQLALHLCPQLRAATELEHSACNIC